METILQWATIASPIVGVIAIIVALVIAQRSSKETKEQIEAVCNLLDVFVAAQNPNIMEAKRKYEQELAILDAKIKELEDKIETDNFPSPWAPPIQIADVLSEKNKLCEQLEVLESKRKETEEQLNLILSYLERTQRRQLDSHLPLK